MTVIMVAIIAVIPCTSVMVKLSRQTMVIAIATAISTMIIIAALGDEYNVLAFRACFRVSGFGLFWSTFGLVQGLEAAGLDDGIKGDGSIPLQRHLHPLPAQPTNVRTQIPPPALRY